MMSLVPGKQMLLDQQQHRLGIGCQMRMGPTSPLSLLDGSWKGPGVFTVAIKAPSEKLPPVGSSVSVAGCRWLARLVH